MILREATADDGSALEAFDLGDTSSPWLAEVAEIVSGLLAWQRDKEPVDLDRRVVVAELDDEIVAVPTWMDQHHLAPQRPSVEFAAPRLERPGLEIGF